MNPLDLLVKQRKQAKLGMAAALGTLVASSLSLPGNAARPARARILHVCAGVTLVACAYWHLSLYGKRPGHSGGRQGS